MCMTLLEVASVRRGKGVCAAGEGKQSHDRHHCNTHRFAAVSSVCNLRASAPFHSHHSLKLNLLSFQETRSQPVSA